MSECAALPAPLVPADVDLRDFQFMPLDVDRLRDSDLAAQETSEACWAAVLLWCASWHQVPASSLPNDDRTLSKLAGYGKVVEEWRRIKDGALRGWVLCSDGRLYHSVVAEKALEAWLEKLAARLSGGTGNAKRWNSEFDPAPIEAAMVEAKRLLEALNPGSRTLQKKRIVSAGNGGIGGRSGGDVGDIPTHSNGHRTPTVSGSGPDANGSGGDKSSHPDDTASHPDHMESPPDSNGSPPDRNPTFKRRKGQGQGQGSISESEEDPPTPQRGANGVSHETGRKPRIVRGRSLGAWRKAIVVIDQIKGNGNGLTWNDARVRIDDPTAHLATEKIGGYRIIADRSAYVDVENRFREAYEQLIEAAQ